MSKSLRLTPRSPPTRPAVDEDVFISAVVGAVVGAILCAAGGFIGGFIGPLMFSPEANQGPLLGIFFTGPLGFVIGGVAGVFFGLSLKRPPVVIFSTLIVALLWCGVVFLGCMT